MAVVLLSHKSHLSEVLNHTLRLMNLPITCLWPLSLWITGLFKLWKGYHVMQLVQAHFLQWENELALIVHGRINWSACLLVIGPLVNIVMV
ncbi:hypothetical protein K7X08_024115 [Anisodus acutangulus]|uniref:Uncharacterized protein n=1 Tax=Anisodus acutangulus TaxID=402998 RepID=A0A9Q1M9D9_9SOLA|nr:hypothetical protein K7X08_024115 [Anisodus acutangulus]